jgi:hypothetical protein
MSPPHAGPEAPPTATHASPAVSLAPKSEPSVVAVMFVAAPPSATAWTMPVAVPAAAVVHTTPVVYGYSPSLSTARVRRVEVSGDRPGVTNVDYSSAPVILRGRTITNIDTAVGL